MTIHLTRAQRRTMQELTARIDELVVFDAAWFARTGRRHRLRPAYPAEIARQELVNGRPMTLDPDCRQWLTVVRDYGGGIRGHLFMMDCNDLGDLDEETTASIFEQLAGGLA